MLAIDPGINGGLAWVDADGNVRCHSMPDGMTAQAELIRQIMVAENIKSAVIEKVGSYMPGNSGPAAATFARHCGHLEAICYCLGLPVQYVAPTVWQKAIGSLPAEKSDRKRSIKEAMARRYPHLTVTLKTADALGIFTWAMGRK